MIQTPKHQPSADGNNSGEMTLVEHLTEIRDRLLKVLTILLVLVLALVPFSNDIYALLAAPLMAHLPEGTSMIATEVASPFLTPFKLTIVVAVFIAIPLILYHVWGFIAPGLYRKEKKVVAPLLVASSALFYLGASFAYFVVFPLMFAFFQSVAPDGVAIMTDIGRYLDFVLKIFLAFGVAFEVPVATVILVWTGIATVDSLKAKRPYVIVGTFILGMLLTPPDVISQTLLAIPMWALFEAGLFFAKVYSPESISASTKQE